VTEERNTPGARIQLRVYAPRDLETLATLFTDAVHSLTGSRYNPQQRSAWAPVPPNLKRWRARLRSLETIVAEVNARCVGFISHRPDGYVDLLYVRPGCERTGVATCLYQCVERLFLERGLDRSYTEASLIAQPFFQRQGFQATRFEEIRVGGVLLPRWVMYKTLRNAPSDGQSEST
jgi:putative acetyltransferase